MADGLRELTRDLPGDVAASLAEFVAACREALGDHLLSVVLYGSAAARSFEAKRAGRGPRPPAWRRWLAALAAVLATGCAGATAPPASPGDSRAATAQEAGRFSFPDPAFSFAIPAGWRRVTAADATRLEINQRTVSRLNEQGRRALEERLGADLAKSPGGLTNEAGAWVSVAVTPNSGTRYAQGYQLTPRERDALWRVFARTMADRAPEGNKPVLTLRTLEIRDYPGGAARVLSYAQEDLMGTVIWTQVRFFTEGSAVVLLHAATAENPANGLEGLEAMAQSFRWE
jgi:hypothetical protein